MGYISQSTIHYSKGNLKFVLNCTKFPGKYNGYMFKTKCSSIEHQYKKLGACFNKKKDKNKFKCPIFDNKLLSSPKKLKIGHRDFIFSIKREDMCNYNPRCFMSSGLMLDDFSMNLFSDTTKQKQIQKKGVYFPK